MQGQDIHSHEGSEGKHYVREMLSHKELSACLWVFLGRHSGLCWGMRNQLGFLGSITVHLQCWVSFPVSSLLPPPREVPSLLVQS